MGGKPGESKRRMLDSAVALLRRRGAAGVTVDAVLARSGAPRGSVYHHFPGGRSELVVGAVRQAGAAISALLEDATGTPREQLRKFAGRWQGELARTDYRSGCPVVAMTVGGGDNLPGAAAAVRDIFGRWQQQLRAGLIAAGVPGERARRLATLTVAAVEGAIVLCRSERDGRALDDIVAEIGPLLPG